MKKLLIASVFAIAAAVQAQGIQIGNAPVPTLDVDAVPEVVVVKEGEALEIRICEVNALGYRACRSYTESAGATVADTKN